jgi:hypothetical protein
VFSLFTGQLSRPMSPMIPDETVTNNKLYSSRFGKSRIT